MAEASAHKLSFVKEIEKGTTPDSPRFQRLPDTRTTIALQKDTLTSERLTGTRFPAEPRTGASSVSGDIPADLSFLTYNMFVASALQGEFIAQGTTPADVVSPDAAFAYGEREAGEDIVTLQVNASDSLTAPISIASVNEGSTWLSANGSILVETIDADTEEIAFVFDDGTDTSTITATTTDSITIDGEEIVVGAFIDSQKIKIAKAGDTRTSFSILREFSDLGETVKKFMLFAGCEVTSWNLTAGANGIAKSTFAFLGQSGGEPIIEAPTETSYIQPIDNEPFDTFKGAMIIDGTQQCIVTDYNLTINNGLTPRYVVGCEGSKDPTVGQSIVEGSITTFFEDVTLYEKFINEDSFSIALTLQDSDGNQFVVNLPNLRIGSGTQPDVSGDGSVLLPINFTAHYDDEIDSHITVTSIEAP
ncbi:phage tail tube protein [Akkermansiaceae bacterium]|nr:phage tail tube protein [Akkermansiaceae bacterium]